MKAEIHISIESESELRLLSQALAVLNTGRTTVSHTVIPAIVQTNGIKRHRLNKVTRKMARSLIRKKETDKAIAKQIGVAPETIRRLRAGITWKR